MPIPIYLKEEELYNSATQEFIQVKAKTVYLEHSLVSIQKWEQKWHIPFLKDTPKTREQEQDYIRCMSMSGPLSDVDLMRFRQSDLIRINDYIQDPMTATTFNNKNARHSRRILTAEVIYAQMIHYGVPFECKKWHLNSLMTLLRACYEEEAPKKKMGKKDLYSRYNQIEAANRKRYGFRG